MKRITMSDDDWARFYGTVVGLKMMGSDQAKLALSDSAVERALACVRDAEDVEGEEEVDPGLTRS